MRTWKRNRWRLVVAGVLLACAAVWAWWVFSRPDGNARSDASSFGQFLLALAALLIAGWEPLCRVFRPDETRDLDAVADHLALAVHEQWERVATERLLRSPIPLRWSLSDDPIGGSPETALTPPKTVPAFAALPEVHQVTRATLRRGGGRSELHQVYGGLGSGRLLIVGRPGAGKSGSAVLLVLDALAHREKVKVADRARVPVPILVTLHGWDPEEPFVDWLAARLVASYPVFDRRGSRNEARELISAGRVAAILDGLDEISPKARVSALQALTFAPCRIVLFSRKTEMIEAARQAWLTGAAALRIEDVDPHEAADYLERTLAGPPPQGWETLIAELRGSSGEVEPLATALASPLALTLLRDTYRTGDDVGELLEIARRNGRTAAEDHLLRRVIMAAYRRVPGQQAPRYTLDCASRTLSFIAKELDITRDIHGRPNAYVWLDKDGKTIPFRNYNLRWWDIPMWVPERWLSIMPGVIIGSCVGVTVWRTDELADGIFTGLGVWGLAAFLSFYIQRKYKEPKRLRWYSWTRAEVIEEFWLILFLGVCGIMAALWIGISEGIRTGIATGILIGLGMPLGFGFYIWSDNLSRKHDVVAETTDPMQLWRGDRAYPLFAGLTVGLIVCVVIGLVALILAGLGTALIAGLFFGLPFGLLAVLWFGFVSSAAWSTQWTFMLLARREGTPIRLMRFLDDAHRRGVLRTVGPVYQFRHARLQDLLAADSAKSDG